MSEGDLSQEPCVADPPAPCARALTIAMISMLAVVGLGALWDLLLR